MDRSEAAVATFQPRMSIPTAPPRQPWPMRRRGKPHLFRARERNLPKKGGRRLRTLEERSAVDKPF
jgi:hypothetical protein